MVFEMPCVVSDHSPHRHGTLLGVHHFAIQLGIIERDEPLTDPLAKRVDHCEVAAECLHHASVIAFGSICVTGMVIAVDVRVDEGILVPSRDHGAVFSNGPAHAVDHREISVRAMSDEHADRPQAHTCIGQEGHVDLALGQIEDAPVDVLDPAAIARDQRK